MQENAKPVETVDFLRLPRSRGFSFEPVTCGDVVS